MRDDQHIKQNYYLMMDGINGIGPVGQQILLDKIGSIEACFELSDDEIRKLFIGDNRGRYAELLINGRNELHVKAYASEVREKCLKEEINIITVDDHQYPERMRNIREMPKLLYVKGYLNINAFPESVGIVGARRCSHEGKQSAIDIATNAVNNDRAIISGMAKGIDSYAHTAGVLSDGYTIAVLGSGPDLCYPKEHYKLYESIAENGCLLSQYPPGTEPRRFMFPARNRLIAALSDELYVIDVGRRSGTESTVVAASRYGHPVNMIRIHEPS